MDNYFKASDILDKAIGTDAYFPIKSILLGTKTADVAPVEHGHWNDINPTVLKPGISWVCRCSLCGCPQDYKHNYCPNCGCCMLGGGEDDTVSDKQ